MIESLSAISVFVKVAQTGSFVAAGRALGLGASAVGKRVTGLESALGAQLLQRNTRRISLTHEGKRFLDHARRILEEVDAMQSAMISSYDGLSGTIRISVAPVPNLFMDRFYPFISTHQNIEVEFDFSDRFVDLVGESFDAAIRVGHHPDGNIRSHFLGKIMGVIVASPTYLERRGHVDVVEDLSKHTLIHYRSRNSGLIQPWPLPATRMSSPSRTIVCNDIDTRIKLAAHGEGIAYLPAISIRHYLDADDLRVVLAEHIMDASEPVHVVWPYAHRYALRQRLLIDFLKGMQI